MMPKLRKVAKTPVLERFSVGKDSLKRIHPIPSKIPMNSRIIKIPCQPTLPVNNPPMTGAATGATPLIAPITASILASSFPENLSVATEREITIPPAPATPCISRKVTNE
ncbi:unknown [Bacteroides faecis CAG:32]|nr:unknown [Bacteroides faecis CAG:32]